MEGKGTAWGEEVDEMYTSPREVEVVKHAGLIQDAYCAAYKKRYKTEPFIETEDLQVFAFLSKNFGLERGSAVVAHYLKMDDDWFLKKAHNAHTLRKDIQKVIADLGVKEARGSASGAIKIKTQVYCDKCHKLFDWVGSPDELARDSYQRICQNH